MCPFRKYWYALLILAVTQTAALVWMVGDRVALLSSGREIVLETVPVDPRSLFRGDYVRLRYKISSIDQTLWAEGARFERNDEVYVTLRAKGRAHPEVISVGKNRPGTLKADELVIRGRVTYAGKKLSVRYGLERYYVPEGEGKRLERMVGKNNFSVLAAISGAGEAAIKGLMIDGALKYEEPLF